MLLTSKRRIVVLDDDPTGTQTVRDLPVLTEWSVEALVREFETDTPVFYILTNSRSLPESKAVALNRNIATALREASRRTGTAFSVVSRSDSTLRGHFPAELDALESVLGKPDGRLICPYFEEGGRYTIEDVHYVREGDYLIPASETPFAADPAFGYRNSNLREWIAEKSSGKISAESIVSLSLETIRTKPLESITTVLEGLSDGRHCIINAACPQDVLRTAAAIHRAEANGKRFLFRSAASIVAALAGIPPAPPLDKQVFHASEGAGVLIIVGSYVPKTTSQLEVLRKKVDCAAFELNVDQVLDESRRDKLISEIVDRCRAPLAADRPVIVYTSRQRPKDQGEKSLRVGKIVSDSLIEVVRRVQCRPRVLIAKGGITSSDTATAGCGIRRGWVLGQIIPGVPVWRCGRETRFPGMPLVVFPGNVGDENALAEAVLRTL
ncbi:four-carbon acid sugar kinase family protein [Thermostilla marina]